MKIPFSKWHGAGNDFIVLSANELSELSTPLIQQMCDRRFGIGADGLLLLRPGDKESFHMQYINADGSTDTFCGNGSRCASAYAYAMGWISDKGNCIASDGVHQVRIIPDGLIAISMMQQSRVYSCLQGFTIHTGSPHYVTFVEDVASIDVAQEGERLRHHKLFQPEGMNVNFVQHAGEKLLIRTYERGVEAETLACGTGIIAAVIAYILQDESISGTFDIAVEARGGTIWVSGQKEGDEIEDVWMKGPAQKVFEGIYSI